MNRTMLLILLSVVVVGISWRLTSNVASAELARKAITSDDAGVSVEALLRAPFVGQTRTTLSPDGELFVYMLCDTKRQAVIAKPPHEHFTAAGTPLDKQGCALWIVNTQTPKSRQLTGSEAAWDPAWSPDGKSLAFYSDRDGLARLWVWTPRDGRFHKVTDEPIHGGNGPVWTPDSRNLLVTLVPESLGLEAVTTSHGQAPVLSQEWRYEGSTVRVFHANTPGSVQAATGNAPLALDPEWAF
ncbi:MAG TPA: hypothetical protein VNB49_12175, partial [Candidatus Dormibacteraeota bacterium]|nr:hypothetical protein [Candidatus Dormibacteraeota bacterium]